jgi:hypothetical protein
MFDSGCREMQVYQQGTDMIRSKTFLLAAFASLGGASVALAQETTGVPICDEFIAKYEACVKTKVPAASQKQMSDAIAQMRTQYKTMAANEQSKAQMPAICKQSMDATKQQMQAMGCAW